MRFDRKTIKAVKAMEAGPVAGFDYGKMDLRGCRARDLMCGRLTGSDLAGMDCTCTGGASFCKVALNEASLAGANLSDAVFSKCYVGGVRLNGAAAGNAKFVDCTTNGLPIDATRADLHHAMFSGFNCDRPNFIGARLTVAMFVTCNISRAKFDGAKMHGAYFVRCDLQSASFEAVAGDVTFVNCQLDGADFCDAQMSGSRFVDCSLDSVHTDGCAFFDEAYPSIPPGKGAFEAYKVCYDAEGNPAIVSLEVPEYSERSSGAGRKCRCSKARVVSITRPDGSDALDNDGNQIKRVFSKHNPGFQYELGAMAEADSFDENRFKVCGHGIHFFMTREEAVAYAEG